jgi:hypothetical protein
MAAPEIKEVKISDIKSKLLRPALTSNFLCEFFPPEKVKDFLNLRSGAGFIGASDTLENKELIRLSCSEASLPGSSLATNEINNDYTGVTERHAYRRLYDDRSDFTFYVDSEYRIIDFFENWISYVVGENSLKGQENRKYNYRVNFPNDYKTDYLYITKFEKDYTRSERGRPLTYQFINAYPISINSMPVSYDSSQLLKCTISFTYSRYVLSRSTAKYPKVTNNNKPPKFGTPEWYNTYAPFGSEAWDSLYARNVPEPGDLS